MTDTGTAATPDRPRPLVDAAREKAGVPAVLGTLVALAAATGLVTRTQADLVSVALAAVCGLSVLAGVAAALVRTIRAGEDRVTPVDDPRGADGDELVPRTGEALAEVLELLADRLTELQGPIVEEGPPMTVTPWPVEPGDPGEAYPAPAPHGLFGGYEDSAAPPAARPRRPPHAQPPQGTEKVRISSTPLTAAQPEYYSDPAGVGPPRTRRRGRGGRHQAHTDPAGP